MTIPALKSIAELTGRDYAVEVVANIANNPPEIALTWPGDQYARAYSIRRKQREENVWKEVGTAEGPATLFNDRTVQAGIDYEYQVVKDSSLGIQAYGYICSGIELPLHEDNGKVIVVVEATLAQALAPELLRLEYDLIGEGWAVERAVLAGTNSPVALKELIQSIYAKDPAHTRSLFLFGHLPVAYSGNIMPDGHDNHLGAWPADVYYADLDGSWTDSSVDSSTGEQSRQWNVPGDGKFDQDHPPSALELEVGRVDFSRLTCFENKTPSRSELDLARQYLDKDHRFRIGQFPVAQRAIIFDRIESKTAEPVSAMAWRNFAPLVGRDVERIGDLQYFPKASSGTYLWSGVCAGGSYTASDHVGTSDAFALNDVNVVFTTFLGSYYGDWDVESSFLRSVLGAGGTTLCTAYSGQPQWMFHPMGIGEPVGYCARITQENGPDGLYPPHNNGAGQIHIALLGDPTLRAYPVPIIRNLRVEQTASGLALGWQVPVIENLIGFHVYKAPSPNGPYQRLTSTPIGAPYFVVPDFQSTDTVMVKAVALTRTPSGSFYNSSVGVLYPDPTAELMTRPPDPPSSLSVAKISPSGVLLTWIGASAQSLGFRLERKDPEAINFREIASLSADTLNYLDNSLPTSGAYVYRVRAFNRFGSSEYSNQAVATTVPATGEYIGLDSVTQGNWIGSYGRDGHIIPGWEESLPPSLSLITSNVILFQTGPRDDIRAPQLSNSDLRSANSWVNGTPMAFHFNFTDNEAHQVALYTAAWGRRKPAVEVEILDAVTGASLDHRTFENIDEGAYAIYNVRRQVYVRITPPSIWTNAEIYGLFFDRAKVAPLQIYPNGGAFAGRTQVEIKSPTPSVAIYYTLDGTDPSAGGLPYRGPFILSSSAHLRARAFREGYEPTAIADADFQNQMLNLAGFISWDTQTGGTWPGKYGSEGFSLPMRDAVVPSFFQVSVNGASAWTWNDQSSDLRAPLVDRAGGLRQARTWFAPDVLTLNLSLFDKKMHAVSLYFLDFDGSSRVQQIDLLTSGGELIDRYKLEDFGNGAYLTLGIEGEVQIRITRLAGPNAVLAGIFVDAAPSALSFGRPAPLAGVAYDGGRLNFETTGFPGLRICTDRSKDLTHWECWLTNSIAPGPAQLGVTVDLFEPKQFFRTHFVP